MSWLKQAGRYGFERIESLFDKGFGSLNNPLYHLGALGWFFYWIVAVTGIYLYIFFDTGVSQAYESVEYLTHTQWYAGGVTRSLHRYASDALVVVMVLHLLREYCKDRLRGPRSFAWIIGTAALWLVFASGISGYWIVWDKLAQYVALATSEWLDSLPIFGQSIARNFLHEDTLSGRFFSLMVFIHIAVPLILLFVLWIHIQRVTHADVNPPKRLAVTTLVTLIGLSLAYPATSQGPADLAHTTSSIGLDWFYMAAFPALDYVAGGTLWMIVGGGTILMLLLPWLPPHKPVPVVVNLDNCNGCGRCADDCPFGVISMRPRTDESSHSLQAYVEVSKCTGCGVCIGSCPTATPFRRRSELVSGIDFESGSVSQIRMHIQALEDWSSRYPRVILFACGFGGASRQITHPAVQVVELTCVAQLAPSFIDYVLSHSYADGVFITGCRTGDCHYRLGIRWTDQRLAGERDPYLRQRVPRDRVETCWSGFDQVDSLNHELNAFVERLQSMEKSAQTGFGKESSQGKVYE